MVAKFLLMAATTCFMWTGMAEACSLAHYTGYVDDWSEVRLTGRTMDLTTDLGVEVTTMLRIVPRGVEYDGSNYSDYDTPISNPVKWVSKYGCLTVDDLGEGINEKGLSVDMLYLDSSQYLVDDGVTQAITHVKILRYLLTQAATVSEALALFDTVRVIGEYFMSPYGPYVPGLHWAIRDANNDMAIVEFVNAGTKRTPKSEMRVYRGTNYDVMTNDPTLDKELRYFKHFAGGERALGGDFNSMDRFVRLKMFKRTLPASNKAWKNVCNVFQLMGNVQPVEGSWDYSKKELGEMWPNVWTSVMDHNNMVFYLRQVDYPNTVWVDLKKIDFNILDKLGILDPRSFDLTGDVTGKFEWKPVEEGNSN